MDKKTKETMERYHIENEELTRSKADANNAIHVGVYINFWKKMTLAREEKSKLKHFLEGKGHWSPESPA